MSTNTKTRIHSLDLLRGFALLGILIMNIISFSHVGSGYINPTLGAGLDGVNGYMHTMAYLLADMRFMSLFSILFGAGVILFSESIIRKGHSAVRYHYRRMFWLFVFGMIHAYFIWMGDILVAYSICGAIVFLLRNKKIRTLLILSGILFFVPILFSFLTVNSVSAEELSEIFNFWRPSDGSLEREINAYRGSYLDQMSPRIKGAIMLQTVLFITETAWRVLSMMLLGMVLYRTNVLTSLRSSGFYSKLALGGLSVGFILSAYGLREAYLLEWPGIWFMTVGHYYNYIASLLMALGYIGLIMLWHKFLLLQGIKRRLRAAGRMAFTNYILMSVICTFIYNGHGLGLFATMTRLESYLVVLAIWTLILIYSPWYLARYKQGPLERLWRKLSYGRIYTSK